MTQKKRTTRAERPSQIAARQIESYLEYIRPMTKAELKERCKLTEQEWKAAIAVVRRRGHLRCRYDIYSIFKNKTT